VLEKGREVYRKKIARKYRFKEVAHGEWIVSLSLEQIREQLVKGAFSVEDLVSVYCQRAYTIGRALHLTSDELFDSALNTARQKDI